MGNKFTEAQIDNFLEDSSFNGLVSLYILKLSFDKKISFNLVELFKEAYPGQSDYCYAYMVACSAFGLVYFNYRKDILTVAELDNILSSKIKDKIYIEAEFSTNVIDFRKNIIKKVEDYFK